MTINYLEVSLSVNAEEQGVNQETGDKLFKIHLEPLMLNKQQYKLFKELELNNEDGVVKAVVKQQE